MKKFCLLLICIVANAHAGRPRRVLRVPQDFTLKQACHEIQPSDAGIVFAPGTYSGDGYENINVVRKRLIIAGNSILGPVIIESDGGSNYLLDIDNYEHDLNISISGITIRHFNHSAKAAITVRNCQNFQVIDCNLYNNTNRWESGGAVEVLNVERFTTINSTYEGNHARRGGGAVAVFLSEMKTDDCIFAYNTTGGNGGAIDLFSATFFTTGSDYHHNMTFTGGNGGAINLAQSSTYFASGSIRHNSAASGKGGGVYSTNSMGTFSETIINDNHTYGGLATGPDMYIEDSCQKRNTFVFDGLGIYGNRAIVVLPDHPPTNAQLVEITAETMAANPDLDDEALQHLILSEYYRQIMPSREIKLDGKSITLHFDYNRWLDMQKTWQDSITN
ncbi:hypothetical protein ACFL2B_02390 [Patescibacteria group bacterium]